MNFQLLANSTLFEGASEREIRDMLSCLGAYTGTYQKEELIYYAGRSVTDLGLVLSGGIYIENNDIWGNRNILEHIGPGQIFAETYACTGWEPLMVDVAAAEDSEILFLNAGKLLKTCPSACAHHSRLIRNLLAAMAQKNLNLSRHIFHTSAKSIRGRLLSYLSYEAVRQGSCEITIPFNRQQLADYLGVDRSALSTELGKMKKEGLLTFSKNMFRMAGKIENFTH